MKRMFCLGLLMVGIFAVQAAADEGKGTDVNLAGMKAQTPAAWKSEKPSNEMYMAQFKLPKVEGDKHDAEVVIMKMGGGPENTVKYWQAKFDAPEGKKIDDVSKVEKMNVGDAKVTYLDVTGTYKHKTQDGDTEERADYRLLGVVFMVGDQQFNIRLVGPAKTVEQHKKGYDEWLKSFKK